MALINGSSLLPSSVACCCIFIFLHLIVCIQAGHFMTQTVTYRVDERQCSTYYYRWCSYAFWWYGSCSVYSGERCSTVPVTRQRTVQKCQPGWMEPLCEAPICSPPCNNGRTCLTPGNCGCIGSSYGDCSIVPCSNDKDCYPGTCVGGGTCQCHAGFFGPNCQSLSVKPTIARCSAKLYVRDPTERVIAEAFCSDESDDPIAVWVPTVNLAKIEVVWEADAESPAPLPSVIYIANSPVRIGVTKANYAVQFPEKSPVTRTAACSGQATQASPASHVRCTVIDEWREIQRGSSVLDNQAIDVIASATSGGQKAGRGGQTGGVFSTRDIVGLEAKVRARFRFDLQPPTHCLLQNNVDASSCLCFPIYLEKDMTTDATIKPVMCGWTDSGSGLDRFKIEVFYMNPGSSLAGHLVESSKPDVSDVNISPLKNDYQFTVQRSGVYSIQLTVFDRANNTARARKLFIYDGSSQLKVNEDAALFIKEAAEVTGRRWISELHEPRGGGDYQLTVVWKGRYQSNAKYSDSWLNAAEKWTFDASERIECETSHQCIDDKYPNRYGFRTVNAITNATGGIVSYGLHHVVDSHGAHGLSTPPANASFPYIQSTNDEQTIRIPVSEFKDGDTVKIWFKVTDMAQNTRVEELIVGLDRTHANVSDDKFVQHSVDQFTSSLQLTAWDAESGIKSISYSIYDLTHVTQKVFITSGTENIRTIGIRNKRAVDELCPVGGNEKCYCTPSRDCYTYIQQVNIDHCKFDRYANNPLQITFSVTNQAGLVTAGFINLGILTDIHCRPPTGLSVAGISGIIIGVCVPTILLLVVIGMMIWRWKVHKDPLPARVRTAYNRTFRHKLQINDTTNNALYESASGQNKMKFQKQNVPAVNAANSNDEEYVVAGDVIGMTLSPKQVYADRTLADGKFAIVKSGTAIIDNQKTPVAIKALKCGFTAQDRKLMSDKISFLASLTTHANIVKFIGSYDSVDEGPVMLLELCEIPLKDWLSQKTELSLDNLEDVLTFALNIGHGVEFLHSKKIVHRRLAVRNVLLKKQISGNIAKLIGFGPAAADSSDGADDVAVPLRWLAPETHDTLKTTNPTYNNQTDAWSYGITVWEMYTRGAKPYPEHGVREVGGLLKRGYRMERPSDCPPDVWDKVIMPCWNKTAKSRPQFSAICASLSGFRSGAADNQQENYYAA